jgi:hypothetical protein
MSSVVFEMRTATHAYWVSTYERAAYDAFFVKFQPLNPKTGKPWQAWHRIVHGADVSPENYDGRLVAYSSLEAAKAAVHWKAKDSRLSQAMFAKRNRSLAAKKSRT